MGNETHPLHLFFFPLMSHGHMTPMVNMAKLFASQGVMATIVTTPENVPTISKAITQNSKPTDHHDDHHHQLICIKTVEFPNQPQDHKETLDSNLNRDTLGTNIKATKKLQEPLEQLLLEHHPDCLVADIVFPWTTDAAGKFGIPRVVFGGSCFFAMSAAACMRMYEPHKQVSSDSEPFVIPNLPGEIKLTKKQVPDFLKNEEETDMTEFLNALRASHGKNYGTLVNSFYELEQPYVEFQKNVLKSKVWHIGPVFLSNSSGTIKNTEQNESLIKWLDSKKPSSVVYVCFGSISTLGESQLREIELGLEASGQQFILVVSKTSKKFDGNQGEEKEVEVTSEGKGLIIRGWAPQLLILNHQAVGGFVTHCGWNSILEGVCAGLPMVTWPGSADQFYNEKFLTDVLKIGVSIGAQEYWVTHAGETVKKEAIEKAVKQLLVGDEAVELRNRAKGLSEMAKQALKEGGSSYSDLNVFMEELKARRH